MTLGFVDTRVETIYVGGSSPTGWYLWDGEAKEERPIHKNAIKCYLKKLSLQDKEFKGKKQPKIVLTIEADKLYRIKSGIETWFTKTLLIRLIHMDADQLSYPVTIHVKKANESEPIIFCSLQDETGQYIKRPPEFDYKDYQNLNILTAHFNQAVALIDSAQSRQPTNHHNMPSHDWDEEPDF